MNKVILLDRDGVINEDSPYYIKSTDEFILIPESLKAIAKLHRAGYRIGVATNQSGVSRGLYTEEQLAAIHQKMFKAVEEAGGRIDALAYCIHLPEEGCHCRKPQPGMLFALAKALNTSLNNVPFVGDRVSDILAAKAAGAVPVMILSPMTDRVGIKNYPEVRAYSSLAEYVEQLLLMRDE
jgi:D-glycero-D-manno-heptose 1,7-bisphosphate phosphatase